MRILITGMAGFIGHHLAEYILKTTDYEIVGLDRLDFSGSLHRIKAIENFEKYQDRISFIWHDLKAPLNPYIVEKIGDVDLVLHLAATTHVDRAIDDPVNCVMDNVIGTLNILEYIRDEAIDRMLYFSTDEVFGPAPKDILYKEWDHYNSGNPYAASKAGAEELCLAYSNTYKLDIIITHTMNVMGIRQHPEKFIPSTIRKILRGEKIIIHGSKDLAESGSRFYIHTEDVCRAIHFVLDHFKEGCDKFNIVGPEETTNFTVAEEIAIYLNKEFKYELVDFHSSRPGHDLRYALDGTLLGSMGFDHKYCNFKDAIKNIINWYITNQDWLHT